ncbi:potassium/sodium hyperpolarization-activated cyclic nucleotide-gated channel 1-like isoform X2 [Pseudomyrmex gracilis]|uniref:potassium/sodium hyperpolarization-activated cyclic nucleotide-gated channel 1-like isoform X2 n=1 Tax=Pseudomyrmex gracilis TaxID=219809 RepID=UPI0009955EB6|nr:potassium/sodium hyperpolarization-activated cyclic nucleotide-gated channel 1-like isoform X2 [Pseudomyrmex gracilis]
MKNSTTLKKKLVLRAHTCELPRTSGSTLQKLHPNAAFYIRWKRNLQKLVLVSPRHPLTPVILRSQAAVTFERKRHSRSSNRWIIHPCSMLRIGLSCYVQHWNIVYPAFVFCIIDIFLNFVTGFVSSDRREVFLDSVLVMRHYAKGYFFVDLITSIPYTWFYSGRILQPGPDTNYAILILEFLPILKIIRMPTVRYNIRQINAMFGVIQARETTIWLFILTLLIFHWSSCISYVFPFMVRHVEKQSMIDFHYYATQLEDVSDWKIYVTFVHVGVSNLIGSTFTEFEHFGLLDKIIRCILLFIGKGCAIYLIVTILDLLESPTKLELKHQQIMRQVNEYICQKKLPRYLRDKLIFYYECRHQGNFFREKLITDTLSRYLNQEILLRSHDLFDADIFRSLASSVLADLISKLKSVIYLEEDVIYKFGTEGDCMYFIASGSVALITWSGKEICHLDDGDHFGEVSLVCPDQHRTESAIAVEVCELLRLDRRDFRWLFPVGSEFYKILERVAQEYLQRIKKLNDQPFNARETT